MSVWKSTLFPCLLMYVGMGTFHGMSVSLAADVALQLQATPATQSLPQGKLLTIEDAVRIGLENHPRIRAARERIGSQEAVLGQQMSAYYPTINFNNSYRTTNSSGTSGTSASAVDTYTSQANLNLTLYNFGKREGTVQAARETVDATREDFSTTAQDVVLSVKQAYYTYLTTQALVRVSQETVRNRELLVRQAQGFYEVGTRARIDVARAEANLYTARADLIGSENSVKIAWVTLRNAMGSPRLPEQPVAQDSPEVDLSMNLAAARAIAMLDPLTGLLSRSAFLLLAERDLKLAERLGRRVILVVAESAARRRPAGSEHTLDRDLELVKTAEQLRDLAGPMDLVARIGHKQLAVAILDTERESAEDVWARMHTESTARRICLGAAVFEPSSPTGLEQLLERAERDLQPSLMGAN